MPLSEQTIKATAKYAMLNFVIQEKYRQIVWHVGINSVDNAGVTIYCRGSMMGIFNVYLLDVPSIPAIY